MTTMVDAALGYASLGWAVFPIKPKDKIPATEHGFKNATTDADKIRAYWQANPSANIGLACGASHLVVVDVDAKAGGLDTWRELRASLGQIIEQAIVSETGGGGYHYLYRANGEAIRNSAGKLGVGIDVRAEGGYIVVPPSVHPSGRVYQWALGASPDDMALPELPDALKKRLAEKAPAPMLGGTGTIIEGRRNDALTSMAGAMRRRGAPIQAIEAGLLIANQEQCSPPLSEEEVRKIAANVGHYEPAPELLSLHLTDWGNAQALAHLWGDRLRYDHRRERWLLWNGYRWAEDHNGLIERIGYDIAKNWYHIAGSLEDGDKRKEIGRWALKCESKHSIRDMLDLARSVEPITTTGDNYDADAWLVGCTNGALDLRTGMLREATPDDQITMSAGYAFDDQAGCPRWLAFLREVFAGDDALIAFIQMAVGYSITGDTREQCLFLCWGSGCNGKSVFLNTLRAMMGDYATNTAFSTFELEARSSIPNDIAALVGKRLITASETTEAKRLNEARVKAVTGGDPLTCRFMRGEFFSYVPAYKVWLAMNHKPVVTGTDNGIWRRIRLIPFTVSFAGRENKTLGDKLREELPGILAWAAQGALLWQACGLVNCDAVTVATQQYREESDLIGQFMAECADRMTVGKVATHDLYQAYENWCREMNEKPITANALTRRLAEMGIERSRDYQGRFYKGLALKDKEAVPDTEEIPF
jgi:putative DNA primase/helicase